MKSIEVCHINGSSSLFEELSIWLGLSRNLLKKNLTKNQLNRKIFPKEILILPIDLINHNRINPIYQGDEVKIIFENEILLALNKPPQIHMHPLRYDEKNNLLSFLRQNRSELLRVNKEHYDRGMLFRLDFETSGVCFYAKTDEAYEKVRNDFSKLVKEKNYYAIVSGKLLGVGELENHLIPYGEKGHKMRVIDEEANAFLSYEGLSYNEKEDISLIKIKLITGMRHQIRIQLSHLGHPILGDELYGGIKAMRLFLHASSYQIEIDSKLIQAKAPVDNLFRNFFDFN